MTRRWALASGALAILSLTACQSDSLNQVGPNGLSSFDRYVAIGTSVSMGTQSDGIIYFAQVNSWPAQLAHAVGAQFTQPLISSNTVNTFGSLGCPSPIIAPLQLNRRYSGLPVTFARGDSLAQRADSTACSPLVPGITLPVNNVAIDGARAYTALYYTPDSAAGKRNFRARGTLYARVLPAKQTQVTAATAQKPTLVSIELGANELLGITSGVLQPSTNGLDGSYVPLSVFKPIYDKIIDSVKATGAKVVLVAPGVPDVSVFPLFRRASEIAADSVALRVGFKVVPTADCSAENKDNLIALPRLIATIGAANASPTNVPFSCADTPGAQDAILTPADLVIATQAQADITNYIKATAAANGFAYAELGSLYNTAKTGLTFSSVKLLGDAEPYGPLISLDGVHPTAAGQRVIARAVAAGLNTTYGFTIQVP